MHHPEFWALVPGPLLNGNLQKRNLLSQAAVKGSWVTQASKHVEKQDPRQARPSKQSHRDLGSMHLAWLPAGSLGQ